jgi:hypothetical protein
MFLHRSTRRRFCASAAFCVAGVCSSIAQVVPASPPSPTISELRAGFLNPPPEARLRCYWWWLNGNTDAATITHDLEEMKAKGFGGALLVDANGANQDGNLNVPAGPTFGSKEWTALYLHALKEADRLGLEITLSITSGWNLGGPDVTPEQASKVLTWTRTPVKGGDTVTVKLPMPEIKNGFYRQIAVLAYPLGHGQALAPQPGSRPPRGPANPATVEKRSALILRLRSVGAANGESGFSMPDTSEMLDDEVPGDPTGAATFADTNEAAIQNLTSQVGADGSLSWHSPAGDWEILCIGYTDSDARVSTASAGWQGLALDHLSRAAFESHWRQAVEPLLIAAKPYHSLKTLATDSWELGGANWTEKFREQFIQLRGYDPVPWLPVVAGRIVGDRDRSTRFLTDLRRTVADLIASEHYDVFAEKARAYGLGIQCESGGPHGAPIDALETFRGSAVPQTEFWSQSAHRPTDKDRFFTKEAASAAHIYGQHFVAAEGETSIGPQWSESLATDLKPTFDMSITEGMNRLVWHEFTSSPASTGLPGQEYFAGTHLNPKVTWWNAGVPFFTYLDRAQYLMQQGLPVADVLYFYGDNVPNFVRLKSDDPAHVLPGFDFDVTNEDALLRTINIEGGKLRGPAGMEWRALALPTTKRISFAALQRVERYVAEGGTLIGLAPQSVTGREAPETQTAFKLLVGKLWGAECATGSHHSYGSGQIFCMTDARVALVAMNVVPDVSLVGEPQSILSAASDSSLDYIHQRIGDTDLFFIRNGSGQDSNHLLAFRVNGELPEAWDELTGETSPVPEARLLPDGRAEVSLKLPPYGSSILVFANGTGTGPHPARPTQAVNVTALKPWKISFQPERGAPVDPIEATALKSWTEWDDPAVRFFSGTATYRNDVMSPDTPAGGHVWLRFSDVREIAHVTINGKDAGTVWAKPLILRVDQYLKSGENHIEIAVTNLWPNRIIGDLQPTAKQHFTSTNITAYKADSPLLPSGLIGRLEWVVER